MAYFCDNRLWCVVMCLCIVVGSYVVVVVIFPLLVLFGVVIICLWLSLLSCFFFFKQKTAYEMRISDWSSDVCSSDLLALLLATPSFAHAGDAPGDGERVRARELGVAPGIFAPGRLNAITDVEGVRVGQVTLKRGENVRTGITAIFPHAGNAYLSRVPAAMHVGNGFGKFVGTTQVAELGELETPVLLTCTLCVWKAADAMADWMLRQPGMDDVRSINPVVGETNDGGLNDIRARPIAAEDVWRALGKAHAGPGEGGSVGGGPGRRAGGA